MLEHFIADDGGSIPVQVAGHGPPLVLLHEWCGEHGLWRPFLPTLSQHFTVYAWDARGHGLHPAGAGGGPPHLARMADDLANLLDHFGIARARVVGHSMGAMTLWAYIARFGCARLSAVGIIDQSPRLVTDATWQLGIYGDFPAARNAAFCTRLRADLPGAVLALIADGHNARARQLITENSAGIGRLRARLAQLDPAALATCWQSLSEADLRPVLPHINVPALLIYGAQSNYYGPAVAVYVQGAIAGSQCHLYPDADHSPHHADRARFMRDLLSFAAPDQG